MTEERSLLGQFFFGANPSRAEREEKVLRYIIHRVHEDTALPEVLEEPYVRRNCSQREVDELESGPELVKAAREHMEQTFGSGELDPRRAPSPNMRVRPKRAASNESSFLIGGL